MESAVLDCKLEQHLERFVRKQFELLEIEREADIEENKLLHENASLKRLQENGLCITKLRISEISTGLFGRPIVKFIPSFPGSSIPSHTITSGDIIGIDNMNANMRIEVIMTGVVSYVDDFYLTVVLEKECDITNFENGALFNLIKLSNDVTYQRLERILHILDRFSNEISLVSVLFGNKSPSTLPLVPLSSIAFQNPNLNETQKEAVQFALLQKEVAILHGPPGTGKTTTLVECILQCVSQKLKVIACAPSNIAVDNLVEKLAPYKIKLVRLGHPARVLPEIQEYSLDAIMSRYDGCDVIDEIQAEISKLSVKIGKTRGPKKILWNENKKLLKEIKKRQKEMVKRILTNTDVVLSTLTSASIDGPLKHTQKGHFDICFIDECSQALEVACWIPLALVKKCVIAGDHNQLPPTIISEKAAKQGLSVTLMERLLKLHGESIKKMLTMQYRMHEAIMQWPSGQLYENKLVPHESVRSHLLSDLFHVESNEDTNIPLLLIDTDGCDLYELHAEDEDSKGNEGEADLVHVLVENLVKSGLHPSDIAVITPYNLQVELIKSRCSENYPKLEIKSVDGFQGREKEAVILSLVRSNDSGEVGFLSEDRRINVAITRAKRFLTVICNTNTVSHSPFLKSFVTYCEKEGEVRSAHQYENQIGHYGVVVKKSSVKAKQRKQKKDTNNKVSTWVESSKFQSYKQVDEIERFSTEQKYRQVIQNFVEKNDASFSFSPELTAFERRVVHEISEELGLIHISQGEGAERFILISKTAVGREKETPLDISNNNNVCKDEALNLQKNVVPKKKKSESLHSDKAKNKIKENLFKEKSEEDFDALISEVMKADRTCSFNKCKKSVAVMSQDCQFCKGHFCFSHFIPESHGCGHLAKAHARSQIRKDGVLYPGSGRPEKKVDALKQSYLQKKLNEKISGMTSQRKAKPKS